MEKVNHKFRIDPQMGLNFSGELVIDNFAGGGGASTGIEKALGRPVDIAINHDPEAIAMHTINHPHTRHYCEDVWEVDPIKACKGLPVGLAWFSPDCKHHSKARGGKPKNKKIRGLAWVALKWAILKKPRVFILENVEEFQDWGPLTVDGKPCPIEKGRTFKAFIAALTAGLAADHPDMEEIRQCLGGSFNQSIIEKGLGYQIEWKELRACDYGAPTIRKRLFLIARCDGLPIMWPQASHGASHQPYRTAGEIINFSIPCPSIFERKRPLKENTLRRIAKGIQKFIVDEARPFIVPIAHFNGRTLVHDIEQPLRTITASPKGGAFALATPFLSKQYSRSIGSGISEPVHTVTSKNKQQLVAAFIAKHYTGVTGSSMKEPLHTVTSVDHNALVTAELQQRTDHSEDVHAFLVKYYGTNIGLSLNEPCHTVTSKDRFGLVTVKGEQYQIVDIGMRMLTPRELYNANGFPEDYIIDRTPEGKNLSKTSQVARCGNAVPPQFSEALVRANFTQHQNTQAA